MYIKEHNELVLNNSLEHDTLFLSRHLIMDYSLLVGIDNTRKHLVVGIIGSTMHSLCVGTICPVIHNQCFFFRLHKTFYMGQEIGNGGEIHLQSTGRSRSVIDSIIQTPTVTLNSRIAGKTPTVLSPELYRNRFLQAMKRYFVSVPDQWTSLDNINL